MVPAMYNLCLLQADFDNYDLSAWRIGGYGGAPMPIATIEKLAVKIPGLKLINAMVRRRRRRLQPSCRRN